MKTAKEIVNEFEHELKENGHVGLTIAASLNDGKDARVYFKANHKYNLLALIANVIIHSSTVFEVPPEQMLNLIEGFIEKEMPPETGIDSALMSAADVVWVLREKK